jgi:hypothetical protein
MITDTVLRLIATAEAVGPWLDDEQAERAIRFLMSLASEGGDQAALERQRQLAEGRQDRELGGRS